MASSAPNRVLPARASSVLTTGEVAATRLDLNGAWGSSVSVHADFTLGNLTNIILRFYVSMDGTNWVPVAEHGAVVSETITGSATRAYQFDGLVGWKFFRASAQGTGTVTNSLLALNYRFLRRASQG